MNSGKWVLTISVVLASLSCKKDNLNDQLGIPYFKVDQYVLLSAPQYLQLNAVGGWAYLTGGSRGIVLYHRGFEDYVAFDRHCTWQTAETCGLVSVDSTGVFLNCACCTSKFSLIDGSTTNGPAINGLLQYNAQLSGPGTLHVWN